MGGGHRGWGGVKKDGFAAVGDSAKENCLREDTAERKAARNGTNPQPFKFPGIGCDGFGDCAPSDKASGFVFNIGNEATAALLVVRVRETGSFLLK